MKKVVFFLLVAVLCAHGAWSGANLAIDESLRMAVQARRWVYAKTHSVEVVEKVVTIEAEPDYGDGVSGLVAKHAKRNGVPVALAKSVALQEGGGNGHNMQINCDNRYWAKSHRIENCALGMMQIIPIFNDDVDPLSIIGEENLERNIEMGVKRLRSDFDRSKGKDITARWYQALIYYYGAEQDGYQKSVMARIQRLAIEEG